MPVEFFLEFFDLVGEDLCCAAEQARLEGKFIGALNSTSLTLIPKCENPLTYGGFRPIYLCKLIDNPFKPLLGKPISSLQGGFVKGIYLVDNVIQVQEALHSSFHIKEKGTLIKLDTKNVFDRVKIPFLYRVLLSFGFNPEFVNLIKACTESP